MRDFLRKVSLTLKYLPFPLSGNFKRSVDSNGFAEKRCNEVSVSDAQLTQELLLYQ